MKLNSLQKILCCFCVPKAQCFLNCVVFIKIEGKFQKHQNDSWFNSRQCFRLFLFAGGWCFNFHRKIPLLLCGNSFSDHFANKIPKIKGEFCQKNNRTVILVRLKRHKKESLSFKYVNNIAFTISFRSWLWLYPKQISEVINRLTGFKSSCQMQAE